MALCSVLIRPGRKLVFSFCKVTLFTRSHLFFLRHTLFTFALQFYTVCSPPLVLSELVFGQPLTTASRAAARFHALQAYTRVRIPVVATGNIETRFGFPFFTRGALHGQPS